jgi:adenosylhomocysteine nucleosidase
MIAVVAALPREIAKFVGRAKPDPALVGEGIWLYRMPGVLTVAAGMGSERVTRGVEAAFAAADVELLISVGLAGSCSTELKAGDVAEASAVVDARTGERYRTETSGGVVLVSTDAIASMREKTRLAAAYGAAMVDMEAATVGRLARARGVGFRAVKGISDGAAFELEGLSKFKGERGEFRTAAFAMHTALRPWTWSKAVELGRNSGCALDGLTSRVLEIVAGREL